MSKQIKLGFDKVPSPKGTFKEPLFDILTGEPLTSQSEIPLKTIVERDIPKFKTSRNSTPIVVNNTASIIEGGSLKVEEQFPEFSEVSTTLLGVPRAEEQLGLFSDVSTLGFDPENWVYSEYTEIDRSGLTEWYNRVHPTYGPRTAGVFTEHTNEQALSLRAFPVAYSYPYGPNFTSVGLFNPTLFPQYINFIAAGRILYDLYSDAGFGTFAEQYFLPGYVKIVDESNRNITGFSVNSEGVFLGLGLAHDIEYTTIGTMKFAEVFNQIEKWTLAYQDILNEELDWPDADFQKLNLTRNIVNGVLRAQFNIRPGYSDTQKTWAAIESKEAFRYQPGRISGFTFGSRFNNDPSSPDTAIEWGISNETDEYLFQLKGADFNIIRRSTVPLSDDLIERMGLDPQAQKYITERPGTKGGAPAYELTISRDLFNKDSLNGNGPSGYNASFENVTMWKIEFGWYGAIGAKFYAYVPVGNDECRWVLVHYMIIENGIDKPCLVNPNFRFKYLINIEKTSRLKQPVFAYKYGSSTYIDGGDEGTFRIFSTRSELKEFSDNSPILALFPKKYILNRDSIGIRNEQKAYPSELVIDSTEDALIRFQRINGSTEGFHFHYSPSLKAGRSKYTQNVQVQVSDDRDTISIVDVGPEFDDKPHHVIADGLWNVYTGDVSPDRTTAKILRRNDIAELAERSLIDKIGKSKPFEILDPARQIFPAQLVGYNTIVASDIPIGSTLFKIHWLNPNPKDMSGYFHSADYFIGFTDQKPQMVDVSDPSIGDAADIGYECEEDATEVLRFGDDKRYFDYGKSAILEWSTVVEQQDALRGYESNEFYGYPDELFEFDELLEPIGDFDGYGGKISGLVGQLTENEYFTIGAVMQPDGTGYLTFPSRDLSPPISAASAASGRAEIGVNNEPSGIIVTREPYEVAITETLTQWQMDIDASSEIPGKLTELLQQNRFQVRSILVSDNYDLYARDYRGALIGIPDPRQQSYVGPWNILPVYLVVGMRDGSAINNIVVEEIFSTGRETHTPNFLSSALSFEVDADGFLNDQKPITTVQFPQGSTLSGQPVSFKSISKLSALEADAQLTQPLREGETVFTTFIGANESKRINLEKIYGSDRNKIVPNKYNSTALFVTAESIKSFDSNGSVVTSAPGEIQMTLTVKEQS